MASEAHNADRERRSATTSRWTHRWSLVVAIAIFPLIWMGGLVTTQDAGMAVPDWPNTYGYNMFAYPISAWLYGPFDLLIEHGHRLLASLVGILAIGLCIVVWRTEPRKWMRWLCLTLLLLIIAQGILGGLRVLLDARTLAMIHGCVAPLVFAFAAALAVMTSPGWSPNAIPPSKILPRTIQHRGAHWLLLALTIVAIGQLLVGAQLRHIQAWAKPSFFTALVHLHLTLAALIGLLVILVVFLGRSRGRREALGVGWSIPALLALLILQIALGLGTWIANYALPWTNSFPFFARYTIAAKGYWESWIVTGHQATGSLLIVTALVAFLRVYRRAWLIDKY